MTAGLKVTSDIGIFDFSGIETVEHLLFGSIGYVNEEDYKSMINKVEETINSHFS
jgi:NAD(P)H dehydrogenase (quinone)